MHQARTWRRPAILAGILLATNIAVARADKPRDWGGGGQGYVLTLDRGTRHGGQSSGMLVSEVDRGSFGTYTQWFAAEKYRGKRLKLTAWIKTEITSPAESGHGAGLWMRVDGKEKTSLAFDNMMKRMPTGSTDWKSYSVVLDIPDEADLIFFGCLLAGPGQAWVDDMNFEVVGKDTPTTALDVPTEPRNPGPVSPPYRKADPTNLDFEN